MASSSVGIMWGVAMILSNVILMPLDRTIYATEVKVVGRQLRFQRPFFLEFVMFLAMASCLVLEVPGWRQRRAAAEGSGGVSFWPGRHLILKLLLPALCDLVGSWCIFGGAMWVQASVVEMLSCSNTIFTAVLSIVVLKKRILRHERIGIGLNVVGVVLVGLADLASTSSQVQNKVDVGILLTGLGLLMIVIANIWYALEFVVTERLLGSDELSAFMSVGIMGLWGIVFFAVLFPLLQLSPDDPEKFAPLWHEDVSDSVAALGTSPKLMVAVTILYAALLLFNAAAFKTTEHLSAMTRVILGSLVSPIVWCLDLILAVLSGGGIGAAEHLSGWSTLQLVGFVLILSGTLAYNALGPFARFGTSSTTDSGGISLIDGAVGAG